MGWRAPLHLVDSGSGGGRNSLPDDAAAPGVDHLMLAAGAAETARPYLRDVAKHTDAVGDSLLRHKALAAIELLDAIRRELAGRRSA